MAITPLSQAVLAGMDPNIYRPLQDMQAGDALTQQGMDASPTTKWGAVGRLANALAGSYVSNSAASDLAKTIAGGKSAAAQREAAMMAGLQGQQQPDVPQGAPAMSSLTPPASPTAVPPRAAVASTPKAWGDDEAVAAGLYDPPAGKPASPPQNLPQGPSGVQPSVPQQSSAPPSSRQNPAQFMAVLNDPYSSDGAKAVAQAGLKEMIPKADQWSSAGDGYLLNSRTGQTKRAYTPEDKTPASVTEYEYYLKHNNPGQEPMDYATWATAKARAGATNLTNNVDVGAAQSYDKQLAEGLGKSHAALANGVEDSQARARDLAAMQGAVDSIQQNNGTTGGMGAEKIQQLKKTINAGTAAMGIEKPFDEGDISDKEFLQKFNRQIAGAQAKGAVGNRVTNFEMQNYLKANPGLDMSLTGNQRLLGIQSQIEQRNIAVGNGIRNATAAAISKGQKIDPVTVQKLITEYDEKNHIKDPVNGQDLTQSYTLPEFQKAGNNPALSTSHDTNIKKIRRYNPQTQMIE